MSRFRFILKSSNDIVKKLNARPRNEQGAGSRATWRLLLGLGAMLLDEFESCVSAAIESQGVGSPIGTTVSGNVIRRYRLKRFRRYAILMAVMNDLPTVIAFEHSSRRARFWKDRLK